jgi:hypothetical protein
MIVFCILSSLSFCFSSPQVNEKYSKLNCSIYWFFCLAICEGCEEQSIFQAISSKISQKKRFLFHTIFWLVYKSELWLTFFVDC